MNVNPLIEQALGGMGIPIRWLEYKGKATEYIVFNDALNAASLYGDNRDKFDTVIVQVHHYTKTDPHDAISEIRKRLRNAGFTYLDTFTTQDTVDGGKTGFIHTTIRVQIEGVSEDFIEEE
jgi:SAM-dependent methyltransferase